MSDIKGKVLFEVTHNEQISQFTYLFSGSLKSKKTIVTNLIFKVGANVVAEAEVNLPNKKTKNDLKELQGWNKLRSTFAYWCGKFLYKFNLVEFASKNPWKAFLFSRFYLSGFEQKLNVFDFPSGETVVDVYVNTSELTKIYDFKIERKPLSIIDLSKRNFSPIISTSIGRSGSTWLQHLLGSHSNISAYNDATYELNVARDIVNSMVDYLDKGPFSKDYWRNVKTKDRESVLDKVETWNNTSINNALEKIEELYSVNSDGVLSEYPKYYTEKNLNPVYFYREAYKGAKEIFLVRDFRDVVTSMIAANKAWGRNAFGRSKVNSDEEMIKYRAKIARPWLLDTWRQRQYDSLLVKYEELILSPKETLNDILAFLDLDHSSDAINRLLQRAQKSDDSIRSSHITSGKVKKSVNRWQRDLSPELIELTELEFKDFFIEFGYN